MRDFLLFLQKNYDMINDNIFIYMNEMLKKTPMVFKRYMYSKIPWNSRLVGIVGPKGVGKSTMILQYIKENQEDGKYLYISADHTYFTGHTIADLADDFVKEGGKHLFIDEVHKYKNWSRELKQIYDIHSDLNVVFTGSSILDIHKGQADLSRRALIFNMQGLSFREYLELFHNIRTQTYSLDEILANKVSINDLEHPLPLFRDYLHFGYYPFSKEDGFEMRLQQVVNQTIETDIMQYADMKSSTARKLRQMLTIISGLSPYKPNALSLAAELSVSKNNIQEYMLHLEMAGMIGQLRDDTGGIRGLGKVEKVYVDNTNLMYAISTDTPDIGNIRETFFYNQTRVFNDVISSKESDFKIGKYTFEVGGQKKGKKQIENIPDSFIVKDDIETGHGIVIPLWHFGMSY